MAKKILKRSLALGALMAFVITGSAMAADLSFSPEATTKPLEGDNVYVGLYVSSEEKVVKGDNIDFESKNAATNNSSSTPGINSFAAAITGGGSLTINASNLNIGTNDNGGGDRGIRLVGENNKLVINADNIKAYTGDEFVHVRKGANSVATITTNTFYGKTGWGKDDYGVALLQANEGGTINFNAKVAEFDGPTNDAGGVMGSGGWGTINTTVDNLKINGNLCGTYGSLGGAQYEDKVFDLTVKAGLLDMQGNVNAGSMNRTNSNHSRTTNVTVTATDANSIIKGNLNAYEKGNITVKGSSLDGVANIYDVTTTGAPKGTINLTFNSLNTWTLTGASSVTSATFGEGSSLVIDGTKFTGNDYAITGKVSMDPTANLVIKNSNPNTNYKVVKGENNISDSNLSYNRTELVAVENTNGVYEVEFKSVDKASDAELTSAQNKAVAATGGDALAAPGIIKGAIGSDAPAGAKDLVSAITSSDASIDQKAAMVNAVAKIGEAGGTTANAASVVNNVTGITTQRMSFTNVSTTPQGGHGKVERKYKSGAGVWAQYMHGKDKVEDMPSAGGANSYDSQYNGAVIGYDFKEVGKTHTGISFNYGEGDSHSKNSIVSTRNDFDFWGVGVYTSIMNDDTNLIFDINYNKSDADVKQIVAGHEVTVNPNTTSFSIGVKAEKLIQNGPVQIVPYAGARFLTIDTDEYTSSAGSVYNPERQNIWLIPVGVSLRQENVYENGWKVTPKADLSYIWALGDTDSSMTVTTGAASDPIAYTVMDDGSFLGTVGVEAEKGNWTYGLSYSYQKGEYQRSDKWFVDVRYSF